MPDALYPTEDNTGQLSFALERFVVAGGGRIELTGRWYGVRGRRFVRPTLLLSVGGTSERCLAELDHKPWAAEDGELWTASFPLGVDPAEIEAAELGVATDITVSLPLPDGAGGRPRPAPAAGRSVDGEDPVRLARELSRARSRLQSLLSERGELERELDGVQERLERAQDEQDRLLDELDQLRSDLERERNEREAWAGERERLEIALDRLRTDRNRLEAGREKLRGQRDELRAATDALAEEREELRRERDALRRERERLRPERAAALAPPAPRGRPGPAVGAYQESVSRGQRSHADWSTRLLALVFILGVVIVLLVLVKGG